MIESEPLERRVLQYKHHIHANPEVGWQEINTSSYIKEQLNAVSLIEGLGENKTGAVFVVCEGKTSIFVRADIDALKTSTTSQHLCGHSTHTAALMGAYHWLQGNEKILTAQGKQVTFIFQPAEEVFPSGARTFLDTYPELFRNSTYGFGIHVRPNLPLDTIQIQQGPTWAANDIIQIAVKGFSAHIKDTPNGIDAIDGASQIIRLFRAYQKEFDGFGKDIVFNFNLIKGGVSSNTIADNVFLKGAVRWTRKEDQEKLIEFFGNLPSVLEKSYPGTIDIEYIPEVPPACNNEPELAEEIANYMEDNSNFTVTRIGPVTLGSEDFSYYTKMSKTVFSHIGIDCPYELHDPRMFVSDEATINAYYYWKHLLQWWIDKPVSYE
jgi:amidohydrolase